MLTGFLVMSCVLMAVLFTVIASWMQDHGLHGPARVDLAAAGCCATAGALVPFGGQVLPAGVLVVAALLGAAGLQGAGLGRG